MRRLLLILFMVLLPMRGWAGDAMALAAALMPAQAVFAAASPTGTASTPRHPCHGAAVAPAAAGDGAAAQGAHGQHGARAPSSTAPEPNMSASTAAEPTGSESTVAEHASCTACDLCHGSALLGAAAAVCALAPAPAHAAGRDTPFASALLAERQKPPIS